MKKIFLLATLATLSTSAFSASTTSDQHYVIIQNSETADSFGLNTETNRTEYRTETERSICFRDVFDGYQTICNGVYVGLVDKDYDHDRDHDHDHDHDGRRGQYEPRPMPPACYTRPIYRSEMYTCWKPVSVPYDVFDHASTANVTVKIAAPPESLPANSNCGVRFTLAGDYMSAANNCAQYIAIAGQTVSGSGYIKNYKYEIKLLDAEVLLAPLAGNLEGLEVNGSELVVKTGNLRGGASFSLKLYVERKRLLKKDIVLIDRNLNAGEYSYQPTDARTGLVHINLQKLLGSFEENKKNIIRVSLDVNIKSSGSIQNTEAPALHQEASITINK